MTSTLPPAERLADLEAEERAEAHTDALRGLVEIPAGIDPSDLLRPAPWTRYAACAGADTDLFFPEREGAKDLIAAAKALCGRCPVADACLAHALDHGERGVWGGTTDGERRRMRSEAA